MSTPKQITLILPEKVIEELRRVEQKTGIRIEDLIMRALVKVLEEFKGE